MQTSQLGMMNMHSPTAVIGGVNNLIGVWDFNRMIVTNPTGCWLRGSFRRWDRYPNEITWLIVVWKNGCLCRRHVIMHHLHKFPNTRDITRFARG